MTGEKELIIENGSFVKSISLSSIEVKGDVHTMKIDIDITYMKERKFLIAYIST